MTGHWVVTGASGFLGGALVRHLHKTGLPVVAVARRRCALPGGVRLVELASYDDAAGLAQAMAGASTVLHLASIAHHKGTPQAYEESVRAAASVAAAAVQAQLQRLVLTSSIGVNGQATRGIPFTEHSPPDPQEPYAHSKLRAEEIVRMATAGSTTQWVIVRPPMVYGPHAPGNFGRLVRAVHRGAWLPLASIRNARTFIALDNLLDLLVLCAQHPAAAGQLFLAGDAQELSTPELVRCIADGLNRPAKLLPCPPLLLRAATSLLGQPRLGDSLCASLQIDASKARGLLDWNPRIMAADGVRRAAQAEGW